MDDRTDRPIPELDALYADRKPPPSLEERAMQEFRNVAVAWRADARAQRTHATSRGNARVMSHLLRIAAAVTIFIAGFATARLIAPADGPGDVAIPAAGEPAGDGERRYMLLLWERPDFAADVPPERLVAEYTAWAAATARTGIAISGHELGVERVVVQGAPEGVPARERVGGFFIVAVPDAAAARRLAEGHPHIAYGGRIEIAEVL